MLVGFEGRGGGELRGRVRKSFGERVWVEVCRGSECYFWRFGRNVDLRFGEGILVC